MLRKRIGFTLVELLIVIAIISLLVTLMAPALGRMREAARSSACQGNLHAIGVGFRLYLERSGDRMPVAAQLPSAEPELPAICEVLEKDVPAPESFRCPADAEEKYFKDEGTSYEYPAFLRGLQVDDSYLGKRWGETMTPVLYDFEPFHNEPDKPGAMNFLFADGHVGSLYLK
ncbi:MAG: type II secretion system protein [Sedimentisphaerales bacterium]|nr:type II secretion system protein [Sedimentisphaerales bacterium]